MMFLSPSLLSFPFYRLMNDDYIPSKNVQGPFKSGFMFLLRLAWQSRLRLPALVFLAYMLFDIRIQFEMNIHPQREMIDDDTDDEDDDEDDVEDDDEDDTDEGEIGDADEVYEMSNHYHQHIFLADTTCPPYYPASSSPPIAANTTNASNTVDAGASDPASKKASSP